LGLIIIAAIAIVLVYFIVVRYIHYKEYKTNREKKKKFTRKDLEEIVSEELQIPIDLLKQNDTKFFQRIKHIKQKNQLDQFKIKYFNTHKNMGMKEDVLESHKININRILNLNIDELSEKDNKSLRDFEYFLKLSCKILVNAKD